MSRSEKIIKADRRMLNGRTTRLEDRINFTPLHKTIKDFHEELWLKYADRKINLLLLEDILNDQDMTRPEQCYCIRKWLEAKKEINREFEGRVAFYVQCPECSGFKIEVTVTGYRCRKCQHSWEY